MAYFPMFGPAVHAVLSFVKAGGNPLELSPPEFEVELYRRIQARPTMFPDHVLRHVHACWRYIGELLQLADAYRVEYRFPNGKEPDLLLLHRDHAYIVDIKTAPCGWVPSFSRTDKLYLQVVETSHMLRRAWDIPVYGGFLLFPNLPKQLESTAPSWHEICQLFPVRYPQGSRC